jgi:Alginate export
MRRTVCLVLALMVMGTAYAELQNVEVHGRIDIRGRYYRNAFNDGPGRPAPEVRIPAALLPGRAIGSALGVTSIMDWDSADHDWKWVELVTTLGVKADFTDDVSAMIEMYAYDNFGQDFRSNYVTGADGVTTTADDLELLQSYIETNNTFGMPLRLRIGRQRMRFDEGWLISDQAAPTLRMSWDAVRATYDVDDFVVDAFWAKLAENSPAEEDGDVDFYGVRAEYKALEPVTISAWWYLIRDAGSVNDTDGSWIAEWVEGWVGVDDYDVTNLHTVGARAWGAMGAFDYDLKLAYQFGEADRLGSAFRPFGTYGDDGAEWDHFAGDLELGYTFDVAWNPRVFLKGAYFEGEDNRDPSFWDWVNPFDRPQASISFNRVFSETNYAPTLNDNGWMTNFTSLGGGVITHPADKVMVKLEVRKLWANETFEWPAYFSLGRYRVPIAPNWSFWTEDGSDDLGTEASLVVKYDYSDDLAVILYWSHLFSGDGVQDGSYIYFNGNGFMGGTDDEDSDYVFLWFILKF